MTFKELQERIEKQTIPLLEGEVRRLDPGFEYRVGEYLISHTNKVTKPQNIEAMIYVWKEKIKNQFTLDENNHTIILEASLYWDIFKKVNYGREILKKSYKINGIPYRFCEPSYYFNTPERQLAENWGIYGIYYKDELWYIGSTKAGFITRWTEHAKNFQAGQGTNKMYAAGKILGLEDIHFEELLSAEEIQDSLSLLTPLGAGILKVIEFSYIKALKPAYNVLGISAPFDSKDIKMEMLNNPDLISLTDLCKRYLIEDEFKKEVKSVLIENPQ